MLMHQINACQIQNCISVDWLPPEQITQRGCCIVLSLLTEPVDEPIKGDRRYIEGVSHRALHRGIQFLPAHGPKLF